MGIRITNFAVEWDNGLVFWSNEITISLGMFFNSKVITHALYSVT